MMLFVFVAKEKQMSTTTGTGIGTGTTGMGGTTTGTTGMGGTTGTTGYGTNTGMGGATTGTTGYGSTSNSMLGSAYLIMLLIAMVVFFIIGYMAARQMMSCEIVTHVDENGIVTE
jgi:hypothetical protein